MACNTSDVNGIRLHRTFTPGVDINGTDKDVAITFRTPVVLANGMTDIAQTINSSGRAMLVIGPGILGQTTLPPRAYTAILSGAGGTTGVGLIDVFEVP